MFFMSNNRQKQKKSAGLDHVAPDDASPSTEMTTRRQKWEGSIHEMLSTITRGMVSGETYFLTIGAQLHDFQERARSISTTAGQIAEQVADTGGKSTLTEVGELLGTLQKYLDHWDNQWHNSALQLRRSEALLPQVETPLEEFRKIHKKLRMLGISTKIESARLGSAAAGFETLANDVEMLSVQVIDKSAQIACQIAKLARLLRDTLACFSAIEQQQKTRARQVIGALSVSLGELTKINERCHDAIGVISHVSSSISSKLGQVVMSLQFHDIVRQQIEHIVSAFNTVMSTAVAQHEAGAHDINEEFSAVTELQAAQLQHSADELEAALNRISSSLGGIVVDVTSMVGDIRAIAGVAGSADSSRFSQMASDLAVVNESLQECSEANRQLQSAIEDVEVTVQTVSEHVEFIEKVGSEIELIALNSQIKAARTGTEGAALAVLAEAIQRLSLDTLTQTTTVTTTLKDITGEIKGMNQVADTVSVALDREVTGIMLELGRLLMMLQELNGRIVSTVAGMERGIEGLAEDIGTAMNSLSEQQEMVSSLHEGVATLTLIVAEARSELPELAAQQVATRLKELSSNYTMQSERAVHERLYGKSGDSSGFEEFSMDSQAPQPAADDDGLGDNFELF
jgi:methyl-accepting chemotaxis protein